MVSKREMEGTLDKQIELILGRAIDENDLKMLYELDLKTLNQISDGSNQKFEGYVKHFVSFIRALTTFSFVRLA